MKYIPMYFAPSCCEDGRIKVHGRLMSDGDSVFRSYRVPSEYPAPVRWEIGELYNADAHVVKHCPWCAFKLPETMDQFEA